MKKLPTASGAADKHSQPLTPGGRRLRLLAFLLGGLLLFWLPVEDLDLRWVEGFGLAACALGAAALAAGRPAERGSRAYPLLGALAGLAVALVTLLLMAFKTGLHGHSNPDFTPVQVMGVLLRAPLWGAAGLLIGLGWALAHKAKR